MKNSASKRVVRSSLIGTAALGISFKYSRRISTFCPPKRFKYAVDAYNGNTQSVLIKVWFVSMYHNNIKTGKAIVSNRNLETIGRKP